MALAIPAIGLASLTPILSGVSLSIPLLTATAGTFATPLAAVGIIKLGAALAAALGFIAVGAVTGGGSSEDEGYGYSTGYSSGGAAGGSSSAYPQHRRRREAAAAEGVRGPSQEALFSLISAMDTYGCGKQLICELESKNPAKLASDEAIMLRLFSNPQQKKSVNPASPKAEYDIAAELGRAAKNQMFCRNRYSTCPYTADEMMTALRNSQL